MTSEPLLSAELHGYQRAYAFTLATALAWLGHECRGGCAELGRVRTCGIWFLGLPAAALRPGKVTLVAADLTNCTWSALHLQDGLRQMNRCLSDDSITVRHHRAVAVSAHALSAAPTPHLERCRRRISF